MEPITITKVGAEALPVYSTVPISFWVSAVLDVELVDGGLGGIRLVEKQLVASYFKDYDSFEKPTDWSAAFDLSNFSFYLAHLEGQLAGAAALVWDSPGINLLDGRTDLADLWDLRVGPDFRGRGVGRALFQRAAADSRAKGLSQLKIETQNINVNACRFYRAMGCMLGGIHRYFYTFDPPSKHETALFWYLDL